jgi:uncharacterized GH25 family protein
VGQALELVPEVDPTALRAGDTLRVRLLGAGGVPEAGAPVALVRPGAAPGGLAARTDALGRAAFRVPAAGPWMVRAAGRPPSGRGGAPLAAPLAATLSGVAR